MQTYFLYVLFTISNDTNLEVYNYRTTNILSHQYTLKTISYNFLLYKSTNKFRSPYTSKLYYLTYYQRSTQPRESRTTYRRETRAVFIFYFQRKYQTQFNSQSSIPNISTQILLFPNNNLLLSSKIIFLISLECLINQQKMLSTT